MKFLLVIENFLLPSITPILQIQRFAVFISPMFFAHFKKEKLNENLFETKIIKINF